MFKLFKKVSKVEALEAKYSRLMHEAFELSKVNRTESDKKYCDAQNVIDEIKRLSQQ